MKKITIQQAGKLAATALLFCTLFAAGAKADCAFANNPLAQRLAMTLPSGLFQPDCAPARETPAVQEQAIPAADPSIVGLWQVTITVGGQIVDQGFDQYNVGGTEVLNDTPPPATGNVCLGIWVKTAPGTFKLKHPSWTFDAAGNLNGTAIIRQQVTLDSRGNTFKGPGSLDVFDLNGNLLFHVDALVTGQRITVD